MIYGDIIVPRPRFLEWRGDGLWNFGPGTVIRGGENLAARAEILEFAQSLFGFDPGGGAGGNVLRLDLDPSFEGGSEDYRLEIDREGCRIEAAAEAGLFWGVRSLEQLLFAFREGPCANLPALLVVDGPRWGYRGLLLDVSRHFFGVEEVKRLIDLASLHKLNAFHWHLTDDQGWRIEIEARPELARLSSRRRETRGDGLRVEGFYTKGQARDVVAYAASRQVTIVPEIDLPGHMSAAIAAYPELGCRGGKLDVSTRFGVHADIACAGKDGTLAFFETVLGEVAELFPGRYFHIGGDEAPKDRWEECPRCRERIRAEGLEDEEGLQGWFMNRIAAFLRARGKEAVVWNEAVYSGSLDAAAVMQYWQEAKGAARSVAAVNGGRRTIVSPLSAYYLSYPYGTTPLRKAYEFDPILPGITEGGARSVIGIEAPLWTEFIADRGRMDYYSFPRLCAIAETAWSAEDRRDYDDFAHRLDDFAPFLAWKGAAVLGTAEANPKGSRAFFQTLGYFAHAIDRSILTFMLGRLLRKMRGRRRGKRRVN